ncbi:MAG: hypothetical protein WBK76_00310 [Candidatus Saccharimonadales bacterium]
MALRVGNKYTLRRNVTPQRMAAAERRKASLRRTANTFLVLMVIAAIGGGAYTWYMGQKAAPIADPGASKIRSKRITTGPPRQDPNANVGVSVQMLSPSEVKPGENASIAIRTNQLANCTITVKYGETLATDSGLIKKTADEYGTVSWSWAVPPTAPDGKAPVKVDCSNKSKSGTVIADLIVKR